MINNNKSIIYFFIYLKIHIFFNQFVIITLLLLSFFLSYIYNKYNYINIIKQY